MVLVYFFAILLAIIIRHKNHSYPTVIQHQVYSLRLLTTAKMLENA